MTIEALNIIVSGIAAISAAVVAGVAIVALRRFRSQKWWERRVDSYLKVLDALVDAGAYYDRELRAEVRQSPVPEEHMRVLVEQARRAEQEIQRAIDLAELFISNEAHRRLIQYRKGIALAERTIDDDGGMRSWTDYLSDGLNATTTCQADMIEIARSDLEIPAIDGRSRSAHDR